MTIRSPGFGDLRSTAVIAATTSVPGVTPPASTSQPSRVLREASERLGQPDLLGEA